MQRGFLLKTEKKRLVNKNVPVSNGQHSNDPINESGSKTTPPPPETCDHIDFGDLKVEYAGHHQSQDFDVTNFFDGADAEGNGGGCNCGQCGSGSAGSGGDNVTEDLSPFMTHVKMADTGLMDIKIVNGRVIVTKSKYDPGNAGLDSNSD